MKELIIALLLIVATVLTMKFAVCSFTSFCDRDELLEQIKEYSEKAKRLEEEAKVHREKANAAERQLTIYLDNMLTASEELDDVSEQMNNDLEAAGNGLESLSKKFTVYQQGVDKLMGVCVPALTAGDTGG